MLNSLHVENLAVIKCIDIDFPEGFTALTGETGAGKSIIIDSIKLLLGERADRELIRHGEDFCMVSGVFSSIGEKSVAELSAAGVFPDGEGNIMIQRTVSSDGRSTIKINGRGVTLGVLKAISPYLVSIHGQSDTLALTDEKNQLSIIDTYADNEKLISEYSEAYSKYEKLAREIQEILDRERERERLSEILEYQINDIDSYELSDGEEEELVERKMKIKNSEKILKNAGFAFKALKGSEKGSISYLLDRCSTALSQISDVIPRFEGFSEKLRDMLYEANDIAEEVYSEISDFDTDTDASLNEIEERLDKISKLKRKYGYTIKEILAFRDNAEAELETLKNSDKLLEKLTAEEESAYREALLLAEKIHDRRVESSKRLEAEVKSILEFLDMQKVVFFTSIKVLKKEERTLLNSDGMDTLEFFISANRGAEPQPLAKVASGGELARVMLALKSTVADKDGVATVIFDEIDAGVSGKTARKIGIKMLSLSKSAQLISVTHSAQIASLADGHFLISKADVDGRTETSVSELDREGRIRELSRILGGIDVTEAQRRAAVDMLDEKN